MQQYLPDDGIIRKLWINETDAYRDHLLRLDRVSRNRRFSGAISDVLIARHVSSANGPGVIVHGFLSMAFCAALLSFVRSVHRSHAKARPHSASKVCFQGSDWTTHCLLEQSGDDRWKSASIGCGLVYPITTCFFRLPPPRARLHGFAIYTK